MGVACWRNIPEGLEERTGIDLGGQGSAGSSSGPSSGDNNAPWWPILMVQIEGQDDVAPQESFRAASTLSSASTRL